MGLCDYQKYQPLPTIPAADVVRQNVQIPPPVLGNPNVENPSLEEKTVMNTVPFLEEEPLEGDSTMDMTPPHQQHPFGDRCASNSPRGDFWIV